MLARTKGRRNGALPSTADPGRIARRAERKASRNKLSRSRRRSGVLGHFREIDAASPKANALLQPADPSRRGPPCGPVCFSTPLRPVCWAQCSLCYRAITAEALGELADYRYLTPVMAEYQFVAI